MARFVMKISNGLVGCTKRVIVVIDDEEIEEAVEAGEDRGRFIEEWLREELWQHIDWDFEEV